MDDAIHPVNETGHDDGGIAQRTLGLDLLAIPGAGKVVSIVPRPGARYELTADPKDVTVSLDEEGLRLALVDGGELILRGFSSLAKAGMAPIFVLSGGIVVPGAILHALFSSDREADSAPEEGDEAVKDGGTSVYVSTFSEILELLTSAERSPDDDQHGPIEQVAAAGVRFSTIDGPVLPSESTGSRGSGTAGQPPIEEEPAEHPLSPLGESTTEPRQNLLNGAPHSQGVLNGPTVPSQPGSSTSEPPNGSTGTPSNSTGDTGNEGGTPEDPAPGDPQSVTPDSGEPDPGSSGSGGPPVESDPPPPPPPTAPVMSSRFEPDGGVAIEDVRGTFEFTVEGIANDRILEIRVTGLAGWQVPLGTGGEVVLMLDGQPVAANVTLVDGTLVLSGFGPQPTEESFTIEGTFRAIPPQGESADQELRLEVEGKALGTLTADAVPVPLVAGADGGTVVVVPSDLVSNGGRPVDLQLDVRPFTSAVRADLLLNREDPRDHGDKWLKPANVNKAVGGVPNGGGLDLDGSESITTVAFTLWNDPGATINVAELQTIAPSVTITAGSDAAGNPQWVASGEQGDLIELVEGAVVDPSDDFAGLLSCDIFFFTIDDDPDTPEAADAVIVERVTVDIKVDQETDDILIGTHAGNVLDGGEGNDIIDGRAGNDTLIGGTGSDTLIGGAGSDVFVYDIGEDFGHDIILDFSPSEDKLHFTGVQDTNGDLTIDVNDLIAGIDSVLDGGAGGDVTVAFHDSASITFKGLGTGSVDSLTDLLNDPSEQLAVV